MNPQVIRVVLIIALACPLIIVGTDSAPDSDRSDLYDVESEMKKLRLAGTAAFCFQSNYSHLPNPNHLHLPDRSAEKAIGRDCNQPSIGYFPKDTGAFLAQWYPDLFTSEPMGEIRDGVCEPYLYLVSGNAMVGILVARGPNGVWDIDPLKIDWTDRNFENVNLEPFRYDPTNGAVSAGDLIVHTQRDYIWINIEDLTPEQLEEIERQSPG